MKKIVIFGGGTGLSYLLKSLKILQLDLTVIVAITDNGGSTGRIRKMYKVPAMGDLRRCIVALSDLEGADELMNYRFDEQMDKHTIGNLMLAALTNLNEGNFEKAIEKYCQLLNVKQKIYPVTYENLNISAEMEDLEIIEGEKEIAKYPQKIKKIFYDDSKIVANQKAVKAVQEADVIIYSSGSLYSSLLANLVLPEMKNAINESQAKKIYIANLMTEFAETAGYNLNDHIDAIKLHLGENVLDYVLVNTNYNIDQLIKENYDLENAEFVKVDEKATSREDVQIIKNDYLTISKDNHFRHNINRLLVDILNILEEDVNE